MKKLKIWIVFKIRQFLSIDRDWDRIQADLKVVMEKELIRDEQYPLTDREALEP